MSSRYRSGGGPAVAPANRQALLRAAREAFSEIGFGASLNEIAKRAGVGHGTMYRHFPDRIELAVAVFDSDIAAFEQFDSRRNGTLDDLLDVVAKAATSAAALTELLMTHRSDPRVARLDDRIRRTVTRIYERARAAGQLGPHLTAEHVMLAAAMLALALGKCGHRTQSALVADEARALFGAAFTARLPLEPS
ncbi:helix-turn-helix domain-containing protein [Nocardia sp. NPDC005978]|uniref:TetR/AcrR family transcriptional regulator n=1 Tax=Nocardia sp. NPDC005978 TaxID=3156725 RepID=UPI0033B57FEC